VKILLLSISLRGGAGGATYRLHQGLQGIGVDSQILVKNKDVDDQSVIIAPPKRLVTLANRLARLGRIGNLNNLPLRLYPGWEQAHFHPQWLPDSIFSKVAQLCPDVINLHWTCGGWIQIETIPKLPKPVVWTLHDMWAFTGGCVHSEECDRYTDSCGACPILRSKKESDLSRWVWRRKARAWRELDLTIVTPSSWLAKCARSSSLFRNLRIEVIPNGIDTKIFKPIDSHIARELLNLPQDKQLVLFGAWRPNHPWKGFHLLQTALQKLNKAGWKDKIELIVFGLDQPEINVDFAFKFRYLGRLHDNISLAVVYSSADVMIVPSIRESFGLTAAESLACGTPTVAFRTGGLPDLIEHQQNGYLARPYEVEDLAKGIKWVLEDKDRYQRLSHRAHEKIEQEFTLEQQARRYQALFSEIVAKHKAKSSAK